MALAFPAPATITYPTGCPAGHECEALDECGLCSEPVCPEHSWDLTLTGAGDPTGCSEYGTCHRECHAAHCTERTCWT
ncbi:hypothetical protein [Promicromonospora sp. NFX87]|uniref:hypothetical protein n=1 Tax=Promicromonospora sp. NFX87 TaxID=3402691 RepID=UPI003AFA69EA